MDFVTSIWLFNPILRRMPVEMRARIILGSSQRHTLQFDNNDVALLYELLSFVGSRLVGSATCLSGHSLPHRSLQKEKGVSNQEILDGRYGVKHLQEITHEPSPWAGCSKPSHRLSIPL